MNQALDFALLAGGGVLLVSVFSGRSIGEVLKGEGPFTVSNVGSNLAGGGVSGVGASVAGQGTGTAVGGLANPFPGGWQPNRLDAGYDGTFTGQLVSPVSGVVTYASSAFSNWGGYLQVKSDASFGQPSQTLYFAEGLTPTVQAGQHVSAGDPIANPSPNVKYNGVVGNIEWGLAQNATTVGTPTDPLAYAVNGPAAMVIAFAHWAESSLGLAPPTQTSHAGYA